MLGYRLLDGGNYRSSFLILFSLKWEAKLSTEPRVGDGDKLEV